MPTHDCVGLDDDGGVQQRRHKAIEPDKEQLVAGVSRGFAGSRRGSKFR